MLVFGYVVLVLVCSLALVVVAVKVLWNNP